MLTTEEKETILSEFPKNIKLSYENLVYKKVYHSDIILAIPEGKKCFAWFTTYNDKNVCFIMEINKNLKGEENGCQDDLKAMVIMRVIVHQINKRRQAVCNNHFFKHAP